MNVVIGVLVLLIAFFWSIVITIAGILFIPIMLLMAIIGIPTSSGTSYYRRESSTIVPAIDYPYSSPIDEVLPQYYEAYRLYLKSPEWRALRKLVLKRDKYVCIDCGVRAYHKDICSIGEKLQVHHIHYDGIQTMTFTADQCVSVCKVCHEIRHGR